MRRRIFSSDQTEAWLYVEPGESRRQSAWRSDRIREALAEFLCVKPEELRLAQERFDRPRVIWRSVDCGPVDFSVSHADDGFAIVMSRRRRVGIDISAVDPTFDFESVVDEFFSPHESEHLRCLTAEARREEFFRLWSRKEALLKCLGLGVQVSLKEEDVLEDHIPIRQLPQVGGSPRAIELISQKEAVNDAKFTQVSLALGPRLSL